MSDFLATSGGITGSVAAQNLLSIENPVGNTWNVFVKNINAQGAVVALSAAVFSYKASRTTGAPSGGISITAFSKVSSATATAVLRSAPTATAAGGALSSVNAGTLLGLAASGSFTPAQLGMFDTEETDDAIMLAPGEALLVHAEANSADWTHYVNIEWAEEAI